MTRRLWTCYLIAVLLLLETGWAAWLIHRASEGGLSILAYLLCFYGGILFGSAFAVWVLSPGRHSIAGG